MLYTIIPIDNIFGGGVDNLFGKIDKTDADIFAQYMGETVAITVNGGDMRLSRLISTDPKKYLKGEFAPGTVVDRKNVIIL